LRAVDGHETVHQGISAYYLALEGFDHGVGHSLLALCDAKAPRGQKRNEFKALRSYLFNIFIGLF